MAKLRFLFDEEEEKEKFGWKQRTKGIGELPEYEFGKVGLGKAKDIEIPESTKLKFTADIGLGAKATGGITLPEPTIPEPITTPGVSQRMGGIGEVPKKYPLEGITVDLSEANKKRSSLWWSELQTTEDKWKFLKHENWSPELQEADLEAMRLEEQASKMGVNTGDWIEYGVYATFFAFMAGSILPLVKSLPTEILNKLTYKVEGKTAKGQELINILQKIEYPERFGKPSIFDKKIFAKFTEEGGIKSLAERMKGITVTEVTPRFAFGAKLYGGIPADEIVRSLVATGKISTEISKELSLSAPEKVAQIIQNLSMASPAIASKLTPELNKLIPQKTFTGKAYRAETGILARGEVTVKRFETAQEKLNYDAEVFGNINIKERIEKIAGEIGVDLSKVSAKI